MTVNPYLGPVFVIAAALFPVGHWLDRKLASPYARAFCLLLALGMALPGLLFGLYYLHLFDQFVPFFAFRAMQGSELAAGLAGLLTGMVQHRFTPTSLRAKLLLPGLLAGILLLPFIKPILDPLDDKVLSLNCPTGLCRQSTFSTCGPASAVALLKQFGKTANEREIAGEAFTSRGGTEIWYLARTLSRRGLNCKFLALRQIPIPMPAPSIAGVRLIGNSGHFIAVLASTNDSAIIFDPLIGLRELNADQIPRSYRFTGFFLKIENPSN